MAVETGSAVLSAVVAGLHPCSLSIPPQLQAEMSATGGYRPLPETTETANPYYDG